MSLYNQYSKLFTRRLLEDIMKDPLGTKGQPKVLTSLLRKDTLAPQVATTLDRLQAAMNKDLDRSAMSISHQGPHKPIPLPLPHPPTRVLSRQQPEATSQHIGLRSHPGRRLYTHQCLPLLGTQLTTTSTTL